jgi:nicotinate-nucleotide pyrophosphorylase
VRLERNIASRLPWEAPDEKLAIEVTTVAEARDTIEAGFDIIQLEKMTPNEVSAIKQEDSAGLLLAAAGGVMSANAGDYMRAGGRVDRPAPFANLTHDQAS